MAVLIRDTRSFVRDLSARAEERGVPADVARLAFDATLRALGHLSASPRDRARLRAYHASVVRRKMVRGGVRCELSARMIATSVIDDLRATGRSDAAVLDELRRGWSDKIPGAVIEQLAAELCTMS